MFGILPIALDQWLGRMHRNRSGDDISVEPNEALEIGGGCDG